MDREELKQQVNDLHKTLMELIEVSPNVVQRSISILKVNQLVKIRLEGNIALRKLKELNLENEFIKSCNTFDIQEALNISKLQAKHKLKEFNFSINEIDTIINIYRGSIGSFLNNKI